MKLSIAAVAGLLLAGSVQAATIAETTAPVNGREWVLSADQFDGGAGPCGNGKSVDHRDRCAVSLETIDSGAARYGRYNPLNSTSGFIDSQDLPQIAWTISADTAFTRLTFAVIDAFDQAYEDGLGDSFFQLTAAGAEAADAAGWMLDHRQANGNLHWITVEFAQATQTATVDFFTRQNDGFAIAAVRLDADVAAVPLPATSGLLVAGLGSLATLRSRRRRRQG